jgi:hypothetical protein
MDKEFEGPDEIEISEFNENQAKPKLTTFENLRVV